MEFSCVTVTLNSTLRSNDQLIQNADVAIGLIRRDLCYAACDCPDDEDEWSKEGLAALQNGKRAM